MFGRFSTAVKLLSTQNMVGPGEVDDELESETADECSKYGKVLKCLIFEVSPVSPVVFLQICLKRCCG